MREAIIEESRTEEVPARGTDEVEIDRIAPNPDQPRTQFKKEEIEELAASIEKDGLLQPILVRQMADGTYQIIAGERRWQASRAAGLKKVPVRVKEVDDDQALELALIENIQRSDLNPIEEALRMPSVDGAALDDSGRSGAGSFQGSFDCRQCTSTS
ncbi:MAG: ParB/RepB/Spo0J family partition protein [Adlercreutzia equolifaciens]